MSMVHSKHWNKKSGKCTNHNCPAPCQQCLDEHDPDITVPDLSVPGPPRTEVSLFDHIDDDVAVAAQPTKSRA